MALKACWAKSMSHHKDKVEWSSCLLGICQVRPRFTLHLDTQLQNTCSMQPTYACLCLQAATMHTYRCTIYCILTCTQPLPKTLRIMVHVAMTEEGVCYAVTLQGSTGFLLLQLVAVVYRLRVYLDKPAENASVSAGEFLRQYQLPHIPRHVCITDISDLLTALLVPQ